MSNLRGKVVSSNDLRGRVNVGNVPAGGTDVDVMEQLIEAYMDENLEDIFTKLEPDIVKLIRAEDSTDEEIIDVLVETDMLVAVSDGDGSILTDENCDILTW